MNLLAHAVLSPPNMPGVMTGNLTADWIKGRARHALPPDIREGITLHRRIDAFTDTHPLVDRCAALLEPRWHRYSTIIVDILFDHVLSVDWHHCCPAPREAFIAGAYQALRTHVHLLPERAQCGTHALLADDWFSCYASLEGIALSLSRLSARLRHSGHTIELAGAVDDFRRHESDFFNAFRDFFPQLRRHVETPSPAEVH
jgi:acyl carrier protein phosphodiesterase